MVVDDLESLVNKWLLWDQDATTAKEVRSLWESQARSGHESATSRAELERRLRHQIQFGTAGLRGRMQAGFAFMNCLTVIQASQGLAEYLVSSSPAGTSLSVIIGHDTRHRSARFARLAANAFRRRDIRVWAFDDYVPTPFVAFGVKQMSASAGIMITASHNPAPDNGYKVYQANGAQINTPVDERIAAQIKKNLEPWKGAWDESDVVDEPVNLLQSLREQYESQLLARHHLIGLNESSGDPIAGGVYTAMHGVGWAFVADLILRVNKCKLVPVTEQMHPDPDFPTVRFPNPEEDGALQLAFDAADRAGEDIVLANDPDADRFAVAQKVDGSWRRFTGDQVGVLLADYLIEMELRTNTERNVVMLCSVVSSRMLGKIIKAAGPRFRFWETLTGFKWIGNHAQRFQNTGCKALFGYEEALGYMFPDVSWDKDGIAATSTFLCARSFWKMHGLDPWSKLQQLYQRHGYHESINTYFTSPNPAYTVDLFTKIRQSDEKRQERLGPYKITGWRDPTESVQVGTWESDLPPDLNNQMMQFRLVEAGAPTEVRHLERHNIDAAASEIVFTIRASGTEPKIKLYLECSSMTEERAVYHASEVFSAIIKDWISPFGPQLKHSGIATSSSNQAINVALC